MMMQKKKKNKKTWCGGGGGGEDPSPPEAGDGEMAAAAAGGGGGGADEEEHVAAVKARIIGHPLFPQLVAAHLGCLQAAEQLPGGGGVGASSPGESLLQLLNSIHHPPWIIDGDPPQNTPPAAAASSSTLSENISAGDDTSGWFRHPSSSAADDHHHHDLNHFMVSYISLLQSFKNQLQDNLATQAIEAMAACLEIEHSLYELTGVCVGATTNLQSSGSILSHDIGFFDNGHNDSEQHSCNYLYTFDQRYVAINGFPPHGIDKALMHHIRKELKKELKEDYGSKLREVRDEIMRKRRTGKLSEETSSVLKDWWNNHERWPYPTEEEKAKLAEESGLELKQINNWFINQRKRIWQLENTLDNDQSTTCSKSHKNERHHFGD